MSGPRRPGARFSLPLCEAQPVVPILGTCDVGLCAAASVAAPGLAATLGNSVLYAALTSCGPANDCVEVVAWLVLEKKNEDCLFPEAIKRPAARPSSN